MDDLLKKIEGDKRKTFEFEGIKFTFKEIDTFTITDTQKAVKESGIDFNTELMLRSIVNYEGMKVKDVTDNRKAYSDEEWEQVIPFNRKYLEYYLGLNPSAIGRLSGEVFKSYINFSENLQKKKAILDIALSGQSSTTEKKPTKKTRTTRTKE